MCVCVGGGGGGGGGVFLTFRMFCGSLCCSCYFIKSSVSLHHLYITDITVTTSTKNAFCSSIFLEYFCSSGKIIT